MAHRATQPGGGQAEPEKQKLSQSFLNLSLETVSTPEEVSFNAGFPLPAPRAQVGP